MAKAAASDGTTESSEPNPARWEEDDAPSIPVRSPLPMFLALLRRCWSFEWELPDVDSEEDKNGDELFSLRSTRSFEEAEPTYPASTPPHDELSPTTTRRVSVIIESGEGESLPRAPPSGLFPASRGQESFALYRAMGLLLLAAYTPAVLCFFFLVPPPCDGKGFLAFALERRPLARSLLGNLPKDLRIVWKSGSL